MKTINCIVFIWFSTMIGTDGSGHKEMLTRIIPQCDYSRLRDSVVRNCVCNDSFLYGNASNNYQVGEEPPLPLCLRKVNHSKVIHNYNAGESVEIPYRDEKIFLTKVSANGNGKKFVFALCNDTFYWTTEKEPERKRIESLFKLEVLNNTLNLNSTEDLHEVEIEYYGNPELHEQDGVNGLSNGAIAGYTILGIIVAVILVLACFCFKERLKKLWAKIRRILEYQRPPNA